MRQMIRPLLRGADVLCAGIAERLHQAYCWSCVDPVAKLYTDAEEAGKRRMDKETALYILEMIGPKSNYTEVCDMLSDASDALWTGAAGALEHAIVRELRVLGNEMLDGSIYNGADCICPEIFGKIVALREILSPPADKHVKKTTYLRVA